MIFPSGSDRSFRFSPALAISHRLDTIAQIAELGRRWRMNRIGASPARADKLGAIPAIARELEPLPIHHAFFQTHSHQSTIVGNAVKRAELVSAHGVARCKVTT
jgi:hypothetical protein